MLKLGLHKRVFILTLRNEIPKIPLNHTVGEGAHKKEKYKPEWEMLALRSIPLHFAPFHSFSLRHFAHFSPYVFSLKYETHTRTDWLA